MFEFVLAAALMAALAAAAVAAPLWREKRRVALALALMLIGASGGLYLAFSNWNWSDPGVEQRRATEIDAQLELSEAHLRREPGDTAAWMSLGRAYVGRKRLDDAIAAYDKAHRLDADNAEATLDLAETLTLKARGSMTRQAAALFEQALRLAPESPEALFYGGFAARFRGDFTAARSRWQAVIAKHPTTQIQRLIDAQLATLAAPGVPRAAVVVTVRISPDLKTRIDPSAALFVYAREAGSRGPPLAAKRLASDAVGREIELSAADSMIAGRSIGNDSQVVVTARLSSNGQALPTKGDLYGEIRYAVGRDRGRELVIDRVVE